MSYESTRVLHINDGSYTSWQWVLIISANDRNVIFTINLAIDRG